MGRAELNRMKVTIFFIIMILATAPHAVAEEDYQALAKRMLKQEIPVGLTVICKEKGVTGFEWKSGGYRGPHTYSPNTYVFKKLNHKDKKVCIPDDEYIDPYSKTMSLKRCYSIGKFADSTPLTKYCSENYKDGKLNYISCNWDQYTFHPSGLLFRSPSTSSKDVSRNPKNDYKDSYTMSHGNCLKM